MLFCRALLHVESIKRSTSSAVRLLFVAMNGTNTWLVA